MVTRGAHVVLLRRELALERLQLAGLLLLGVFKEGIDRTCHDVLVVMLVDRGGVSLVNKLFYDRMLLCTCRESLEPHPRGHALTLVVRGSVLEPVLEIVVVHGHLLRVRVHGHLADERVRERALLVLAGRALEAALRISLCTERERLSDTHRWKRSRTLSWSSLISSTTSSMRGAVAMARARLSRVGARRAVWVARARRKAGTERAYMLEVEVVVVVVEVD
jgi:hypothetical protein